MAKRGDTAEGGTWRKTTSQCGGGGNLNAGTGGEAERPDEMTILPPLASVMPFTSSDSSWDATVI